MILQPGRHHAIWLACCLNCLSTPIDIIIIFCLEHARQPLNMQGNSELLQYPTCGRIEFLDERTMFMIREPSAENS